MYLLLVLIILLSMSSKEREWIQLNFYDMKQILSRTHLLYLKCTSTYSELVCILTVNVSGIYITLSSTGFWCGILKKFFLVCYSMILYSTWIILVIFYCFQASVFFIQSTYWFDQQTSTWFKFTSSHTTAYSLISQHSDDEEEPSEVSNFICSESINTLVCVRACVHACVCSI